MNTSCENKFDDSLKEAAETSNEINRLKDEIIGKDEQIAQLKERVESLQNSAPNCNSETELKLLLESEKKDKTDTLRIIAHDLRNPLGAISSFANYIYEDINEEDKSFVLEHAKNIISATDSMLNLVSQVALMAHLECGMIEVCKRNTSIKSLIDQTYAKYENMLSQKEQILNISIESDFIAYTDPVILQDVLGNIITNAIKFSPKGKNIFLKFEENESVIRFVIKDEGPGFTADDLTKVFKKFKKLSAKPTNGEPTSALGLYNTKFLLEMLGGTIKIVSEHRNGAEVLIEFSKTDVREKREED